MAYQFTLAERLGYLSATEAASLHALADKTNRVLAGLIASLRQQ